MKKIISSVLATSFIFATCAMNVMAAENRKFTVSSSKTADLEAGDTITVEVKIDTDLDVVGASYKLNFDEDVFSIDTSKSFGRPEKYIDNTWLSAMKNSDMDNGGTTWGYMYGAPTYNQTTSSISFAWVASSGEGMPEEGASTDYVIGKFHLTVKDGVTGEGSTISFAEGVQTDGTNPTMVKTSTGICNLTTESCKVTFKQSAPTPVTPKWDITITEGTGDMEAKDNNKVWQIAPVKTGEAEDISEFKVTLKDGNNDEITKELDEENITKMNNDIKSWNIASVFYVGLLNTGNHENVTATWNIAAGSSTVNVN